MYYLFSNINGRITTLASVTSAAEAETALLNSQEQQEEVPAPNTIGYHYIKSAGFTAEETAAINQFES
jgi:hypothetical protein